jgi:hypothetical protein
MEVPGLEEHAHGEGHSAGPRGKQVAILISILALLLAIAETGAKSAQTATLTSNIHASDLWAQYQAKTIRQTMLKTASEQMQTELGSLTDPRRREAVLKRLDDWKATIARYESEPGKTPGTGDGRVELKEQALAAEHQRDQALKKYHRYEIGAAAFQIAIVLASASIITGVAYLLWIAGGIGGVGLIFTLIGFFIRMAAMH